MPVLAAGAVGCANRADGMSNCGQGSVGPVGEVRRPGGAIHSSNHGVQTGSTWCDSSFFFVRELPEYLLLLRLQWHVSARLATPGDGPAGWLHMTHDDISLGRATRAPWHAQQTVRVECAPARPPRTHVSAHTCKALFHNDLITTFHGMAPTQWFWVKVTAL